MVGVVSFSQCDEKKFSPEISTFFKDETIYSKQTITMAKRLYRELNDDVKKKISDSMKDFHKRQNIEDKRRVNKLKSASMQHYWNSIPHRHTGDTSAQ